MPPNKQVDEMIGVLKDIRNGQRQIIRILKNEKKPESDVEASTDLDDLPTSQIEIPHVDTVDSNSSEAAERVRKNLGEISQSEQKTSD